MKILCLFQYYVKRFQEKSYKEIWFSLHRRVLLKYCRLRNWLVIEAFRKEWVPSEKQLWRALSIKVRKNHGEGRLSSVIGIWDKRLKSEFIAHLDNTFRKNFNAIFPVEKACIIKKAEDIICGRYVLFLNFSVDLGEVVDWHATLINNDRWPVIYFRDYILRELVEIGDVRTTWELNRHSAWVILGKAYFLSGKDEFFTAFWSLFDSWCEKNPFLMGVNWLSSMEVGIRLNHWLAAYALFCDCSLFSRDKKVIFWRWVYLHMLYVRHYFTSEDRGFRNNHLIFEAASLFIGTVILSEYKKSCSWRKKCEKILAYELQHQFLEDGFHEELCTSYHLQVTEAYLLCCVVAGRYQIKNGLEYLKPDIDRIVKVLSGIARSDGSLPQCGDSDDGVFLSLSSCRDHLQTNFAQSLFSTISNKGDISAESKLDEGAAWLGVYGDLAVHGFDSVEDDSCRLSLCCLESSQMACVKYFDNDVGEIYLHFSAGTEEPYESYGHRHADLLNIIFSVEDALLVDSGTYCYNGPLEWRRLFQETKAHNTVLIGGLGQFGFTGNFGIERISYRSGLRVWEKDGIVILKGWYVDESRRLWHCRHVLLLLPNFILIHDHCGEGQSSEAELRFTFDSDVELNKIEDGFLTTTASREICRWHIYSSISNGHVEPEFGDGWVSPSYWIKKKSRNVSVSSKGGCNTFVTIVKLPSSGPFQRSLTKLNDLESVETVIFDTGRNESKIEIKYPDRIIDEGLFFAESHKFISLRFNGVPIII